MESATTFDQDVHVNSKLRVQQCSFSSSLQCQDNYFTNTLEQLSIHPTMGPSLVRVSNCETVYHPNESSEIFNFARNSSVTEPTKALPQADRESSFSTSMSYHPVLYDFNFLSKTGTGDPQGGHDEWIGNYGSGGSLGREVLSNNAGSISTPSDTQFSKMGYMVFQTSSSPSFSRQYFEADHDLNQVSDVRYASPHHSPACDGASSDSNTKYKERVLASPCDTYPRAVDGGCGGGGGRNSGGPWTNGGLKWYNGDGANTEVLSLSLLPNSKPEEETGNEESATEPNYNAKLTSKDGGKQLFNHSPWGSSAYFLGNAGPFGPFTGYAIVLKSSKFLKPALELLDGFCGVTGYTLVTQSEMSTSFTDYALNASDIFSGDNTAGAGTNYLSNYKPRYPQKKAKLLYLQEEVAKMCKQYHQQMQMASSSFESVAGLGSATPYISFALKAISRNFSRIKHSILDQIKSASDVLRQDWSGESCCKGEASRRRSADQSWRRHNSGMANAGYLELQQNIWRPQRGLPERSVAILRSWLFEHFLHPYPTDTDKHMLASQTGLSRNQVSNWFINARVRVWKPMVEEIHILESKGIAEETNKAKWEEASTSKMNEGVTIDKHPDHSEMFSTVGDGQHIGTTQWNQQKRSRVGVQVVSPLKFIPYQTSNGIDIGGLGAVSLTLGLMNTVDNSQQRHQPQLMPEYVE